MTSKQKAWAIGAGVATLMVLDAYASGRFSTSEPEDARPMTDLEYAQYRVDHPNAIERQAREQKERDREAMARLQACSQDNSYCAQ